MRYLEAMTPPGEIATDVENLDIARAAECSIRTVQAALKQLEEAGLIVRAPQRRGESFRTITLNWRTGGSR